MATEKHKKLATIIKDTHNRLRKDSRIYGAEEAWNRHLARTQDLQDYAASMQELATAHWKINLMSSSENANCRIQWIKNQCYDYFFKGGIDKFNQREIAIAEKGNIKFTSHSESSEKQQKINNETNIINMLDVGSCYNPLADYCNFNVTAIDLAPYSDRVLLCDFLKTEIGSETVLKNNKKEISLLGINSFDVCVFSLLLEYFPCPEQRFQCCKKAYDILKDAGILIIITPDSKHVGANAKIMKSWRFVLAKLGFMRIKYEKLQHLHCMCFRKCLNKDVAVRWANMQNFSTEEILFSSNTRIYIPQDFQNVLSTDKECEKITYEADELITAFDELPDLSDI